jgi:hypothetical protein
MQCSVPQNAFKTNIFFEGHIKLLPSPLIMSHVQNNDIVKRGLVNKTRVPSIQQYQQLPIATTKSNKLHTQKKRRQVAHRQGPVNDKVGFQKEGTK